METQPGDLVGLDRTGKVRIDRTVPLPWVLGILAMAALWAFNQDSTQKQLVAQIREMTADLKELRGFILTHNINAVELKAKDAEFDRRLKLLEDKIETHRQR